MIKTLSPRVHFNTTIRSRRTRRQCVTKCSIPTPKEVVSDTLDKTLYKLYTPLTNKLSKMINLLESVDKKLDSIDKKLGHTTESSIKKEHKELMD